MTTLSGKIKKLLATSFWLYPLFVIISVPLLLIFNTYWNLKSFNRDANFFIRHEVVSIFDSIKPFVLQSIHDPSILRNLLLNITRNNPDFVAATVIKKTDGVDEIVSYTDEGQAKAASELPLNKLAISFEKPFSGISYDPTLAKNVWNVVIPFGKKGAHDHLFIAKLKTDSVDEILKRTSRDSILVLVIIVIAALVILANHFLFYQRALEAKKLKELDMLKDEFISMASHELRAPVTGLSGYLDMLKLEIPDTLLEARKDIEVLDTLTNDLSNLVNELLDVSRIEQRRFKITKSDVQVNEIIKSVLEYLRPEADKKQLTLKFTPQDLDLIKTDPDRLRQILLNLVGNSVKYTLKGEILIEAKKSGKFIEIIIKDTGIGIPPDEFPKLFTKFHRVQDEKTKEVRGTGLGLWITKQIIELLGGKIYAQSIYGSGTSITFTIPI